MIVASTKLFQLQLERVAASKTTSAFWGAVHHVLETSLRNLAIDRTALEPGRQLGRRRHDLTGTWVFRGSTKRPWAQGLRIFYIACAETSRLIVLEYGERKPRLPGDAYDTFGKRLADGYHDAYFAKLGMKHAYWQLPPPPEPLSKADGRHGPRVG